MKLRENRGKFPTSNEGKSALGNEGLKSLYDRARPFCAAVQPSQVPAAPVPPAAARQLEADLKTAGKSVDITVFEGADHAFFNDTRAQAYHAAYAATCWSRTLAFYREHVR